MAFKTLFKFGVPFSFVYCTVYQQNIWREGDERLVEEQKKTWRKFFSFIDQGYNATLTALNLSTQVHAQKHGIVSKLDSLDISRCWNSNIIATFKTVDQVVSNPKLLACKLYRKLQPYISSTSTETKSTN